MHKLHPKGVTLKGCVLLIEYTTASEFNRPCQKCQRPSYFHYNPQESFILLTIKINSSIYKRYKDGESFLEIILEILLKLEFIVLISNFGVREILFSAEANLNVLASSKYM